MAKPTTFVFTMCFAARASLSNPPSWAFSVEIEMLKRRQSKARPWDLIEFIIVKFVGVLRSGGRILHGQQAWAIT